VRPTARWWKKAAIYKLFAESDMDFSDEAAQDMFTYESIGEGDLSPQIFSTSNNGYAYGKYRMDWHITEWNRDIYRGDLFKEELYASRFPNAWIDSVIKLENIRHGEGIMLLGLYCERLKERHEQARQAS